MRPRRVPGCAGGRRETGGGPRHRRASSHGEGARFQQELQLSRRLRLHGPTGGGTGFIRSALLQRKGSAQWKRQGNLRRRIRIKTAMKRSRSTRPRSLHLSTSTLSPEERARLLRGLRGLRWGDGSSGSYQGHSMAEKPRADASKIALALPADRTTK